VRRALLCRARDGLPTGGGDYVYLSRAYGPWAGFLFGWAQLAIVRPGDIAVMAFAFATYARAVWDPFAGTSFPYGPQVYAVAATVVFTFINVLGVREGKWTQNLLTTVKRSDSSSSSAPPAWRNLRPPPPPPPPPPVQPGAHLCALHLRRLERDGLCRRRGAQPAPNIVRALVIGTAAVTILYLGVNAAFLHALGYHGVTASQAVATTRSRGSSRHWGGADQRADLHLGARRRQRPDLYRRADFLRDGGRSRAFRALGRWHPRFGTQLRRWWCKGRLPSP